MNLDEYKVKPPPGTLTQPLTDEEKKLMNDVAKRMPKIAALLDIEFPIPLGESELGGDSRSVCNSRVLERDQKAKERLNNLAKPLTDEEKMLMNDVAEMMPDIAELLDIEFPIPLSDKSKESKLLPRSLWERPHK